MACIGGNSMAARKASGEKKNISGNDGGMKKIK